MKSRDTGFTVIELIVALAIAAIAIAMVAPSMPLLTRGSRITAANDAFATSLRYTRTEALKLNTAVQMVSKNGKDWSKGWDVETAANPGVPLRTFSAIGGTVTLLNDKNLDTITYNAAGYMQSDPAAFQVCDSAQTGETGRQLTLTAVGRVSVDSKFTCDAP
jgi:type IV fimbrial biogenesis protein FimT